MERYENADMRVTLSREGLRRCYGDNALLLRVENVKRIERLHKLVAIVSSCGVAAALGITLAWSAVYGN